MSLATVNADDSETRDYRLTVEVIDAETKLPVAGARISLSDADDVVALSDATGKHLFKKLERGRVEVFVTHPSYPDARSVVLLTRASQSRTIRLDPRKLKDVAHSRGVHVGARGGTDTPILASEFHSTALDTCWAARCPDKLNPTYPGDPAAIAYDFSAVDGVMELAKANGLWVMGGPLVSASTNESPSWTKEIPGLLEGTEIVRGVMKDFIIRVMTHYPAIDHWVLASEMLNLKYEGSVRKHPFWRAFGLYKGDDCRARDNIAEAFRVAHEVNDKAVLLLDDYDIEGWDGGRSSRGERGRLFYELVVWLVHELSTGARRVPRKSIAVGFQTRVPATDKVLSGYRQDYRPASIRKQVERFKKLGVCVYVTQFEMDVSNRDAMNTKHTKQRESLFGAQGKRVEATLRALLDGGNCPSVTMGSVVDGTGPNGSLGSLLSPDFGSAAPGGYFRKPAYVAATTAMHEFKR